LFPNESIKAKFEQDPQQYADADLALEGNCPVCLVNMNKVVEGDPDIAVVHDGLRYLFPGAEQKAMFVKNPDAFTPALGGDCTVCRVEMNKAVPGRTEFHAVKDGRLYLFPGQEQLDMFNANPSKYTNADVALGGNCPVCKVDMGKDVPGNAEYASDYRGQRYLFPNDMLRGKFLADPNRYAVE
jgi:YHS domain-containing protein